MSGQQSIEHIFFRQRFGQYTGIAAVGGKVQHARMLGTRTTRMSVTVSHDTNPLPSRKRVLQHPFERTPAGMEFDKLPRAVIAGIPRDVRVATSHMSDHE